MAIPRHFRRLGSIVLALVIAALRLSQGDQSALGPPNRHNGFAAKAHRLGDELAPVELLNDTWYAFYFTNAYAPTVPPFLLPVRQIPTILRVYDMYCAGDWFYTLLRSATQNFTVLGSAPEGIASCANYQTTPEPPTWNPAFSRSTIAVGLVDNFNVTIVPYLSPYSAGAGAIKAIYPGE